MITQRMFSRLMEEAGEGEGGTGSGEVGQAAEGTAVQAEEAGGEEKPDDDPAGEGEAPAEAAESVVAAE